MLAGAKIDLEPRGPSTVSDQQGRFALQNVPPGDYQLTISYVGLLPFTETLTIQAGETSRVEATLQVPGVREEVTVSAARPRGEAQALNRERTSDNIVQVLPAEVITSLPNTNIADAVGRLPSVSLERDEGEGKHAQIRGTDPRLSNVTINGVNVPSPEGGARNVKLDVIPSDLVASIEVNKTLSANQDGDAIGGSVNLVTKTAADRAVPRAVGDGRLHRHHRRARARSVHGNVRHARRRRSAARHCSSAGPTTGTAAASTTSSRRRTCSTTAPVVSAIDLREYRYYRSRVGVAGGTDYRLSHGTSAYLRGLFSNFKNYGDRWVYSPGAGDFLTPTMTDANGTMDFGVQNRRPNEQIFSVAGRRQHIAGRWLIDYDLSGSHARQYRLGQSTVSFAGPDNVAYRVDTSDPHLPQLAVANGVNVYDPSLFSATSLQTADDRARQRDLSGALNITRPYAAGSRTGSLQAGFKIRDADKSQEANDQTFAMSGLTMNSVIGHVLESRLLRRRLSTRTAGRPRCDPRLRQQSSGIGDAESGRHAAAVRSEQLRRIRARDGGLRHEQPRDEPCAPADRPAHRTNACVVYRQRRGHRQHGEIPLDHASLRRPAAYTEWLPSVQLRVALDGHSNVRAAHGRGIARPNFSDLPPYLVEQDKKKTVSVGNPALKPTSANSFDLLFERFLEPLGAIQAGVFYKALKNPISSGGLDGAERHLRRGTRRPSRSTARRPTSAASR